jgi:ElaB/YqjD/DUF883 family membrane-anchored ribosome-binding protein
MDPAKERLKGLESDAAKMMQDLGQLSAKLKDIGKAKAGELSEEALAQLSEQIAALQGRVQTLGTDSKQLMDQIDKSVRANPYLYIAGALGLGVLLGKARRS